MARVLLPFFTFLAGACLAVALNILRPHMNTMWGFVSLAFAGVFGLAAILIVIVQWRQRPQIHVRATAHDEWVHVAVTNKRRWLIGIELARRARVECVLDGVIHTMRWQAVSLSEPPEFLDLEGDQEKRVPILLQPTLDKHLYEVDTKKGERYFTNSSFFVLGRYDPKNLTIIPKEAVTVAFGIKIHYDGGSTKPVYFTLTFAPMLQLKKVR